MDWFNRPLRAGFWTLVFLVLIFLIAGFLLFSAGRLSA